MISPTVFFLATLSAAAILPSGSTSPDGVGSQAVVNDAYAHLANYTFGDVEWRGFEGFEDTVFTGTIENVIHQMKKVKGVNFVPDFVRKAEAEVETRIIQARDGSQPPSTNLNMNCIRDGLSAALLVPIRNGVRYLSHLSDSVVCQNGPGPSNCGRISCSDTSGIWFCNESPAPSAPFKCSIFGFYASNIAETCWYDQGMATLTEGQQYDLDYGISKRIEEADLAY
ncbi:hypothetical protein GGR57DRAFT_503539 [Xylariaceae sp. FL1272]|nr:hypothetical protein GGR57DRAFT_503539 [Xylariaceae sp. FL1272]